MGLVEILSAFGVGFSVGFGVVKLLTKQSQKLLTLENQKLKLEVQALESSARALESKLQSASALGSAEEGRYMELIKSLQSACDKKDAQIKSLEKRLHSFRFSKAL